MQDRLPRRKTARFPEERVARHSEKSRRWRAGPIRVLKLDDIDKPVAAPEAAPVSKFANVGFAFR